MSSSAPQARMTIMNMDLRFEHDIVSIRQRARQISGLLGFDSLVQTRVATAVSEIARNAFRYAGGGKVIVSVDALRPQRLWIRIEDRGPGIADLKAVMDGRYQSPSGLGLGIIGAKRLMDEFEITSEPGKGTQVTIGRALHAGSKPIGPSEISALAEVLAREAPQDAFNELRLQNAELMQALALVEKREQELSRLNRELADTNRGVIALNAELEDKAMAVKQASEIKAHFLTHMTHEFRTPVNSILSLSRVLMTPSLAEPLPAERLRQVGFIRKAAESLSDLVNDILDTAKAEAGRLEVHSKTFEIRELFGALRAMFRPLLTSERSVELLFVEPDDFPVLSTDEGKLAQILRNFISNALKFTEEGRVVVSAQESPGSKVTFAVEDTGIGIRPSDQVRVFEDFTQIENPLQKHHKGTGLGLPLAKRLALLLGGRVALQSVPGEGSIFSVTIPTFLPESSQSGERSGEATPSPHLLLIDDDEISRYLIADLLKDEGFSCIEAVDGLDGLRKAREYRPIAIFLDLRMPRMDGFAVLDALKADPLTQAIPVVVSSSRSIALADFAYPHHAPDAILPKELLSREDARASLRSTLGRIGFKALKEGSASHESV